MLESLRHLWNKRSRTVDIAPMRTWAASHGHELRPVHDGGGCMVEPRTAHPAWRIEWGHPQRDYISGRELRIIGEVGTPKELMAMVLTRELKEAMEKVVFEQYVEDVQTRMDTETPPEMRWLVLYTKMPSAELGRLRDRYAAVCSIKPWLAQWLGGALNDALAATVGVADGSVPMVLTVSRGRLTLRTSMSVVDDKLLAMWLSVFESAQKEAKRLGYEWRESPEAGQSTLPAAWPKSVLPSEDEA